MPTYPKGAPSARPAFAVVPGQVQHCVSETVGIVTGDLTLNNVIPLVKLPRGAVVKDITIYATDMDTNGAPTLAFHVGDAGDPDRFIVASTVGQTGGKVAAGNTAAAAATTAAAGAYTAETIINATVSTAAATAAAGTMLVFVEYVME